MLSSNWFLLMKARLIARHPTTHMAGLHMASVLRCMATLSKVLGEFVKRFWSRKAARHLLLLAHLDFPYYQHPHSMGSSIC